MRRLLLLVVCAVLFGAAPAQAQDDTTAAIAINTKDGSSLFDFAFEVRKTMKDAVEHTNAAVAYANCTECSTVAISFQVVLAGGGPDTVTPTNVAVALNEQCASCLTAAFAYQFVVAGEGRLRLTRDGQRRLARLRRELRRLEDVDLTIEQLKAELDAAAEEIRDVLATEVIRGRDDEEDDEDDDEGDGESEDDGEGRARAAPEETPTPIPTETITPTPTPTATPSATPEPTATATP
jgi:putative peptide zinc metalloprotease protein